MSGTIDRRGATPPDFLVKLLTMVGDEAPDLISWTGGKLYIHDPVALERKMSVYFRHSNFSSFQRQLNNFGFRKVEGKGKLAPCMYMHDDLVSDSAWFPSISQLELRGDGVNAMPHRRDAVDVAVRESTRLVREPRQFRDAVVRHRWGGRPKQY